jgi:uncharacterized protein
MPQFLVIARDGDDPEALDRRMAARPSHLEGIRPLVEAGHIPLGGPILDDEGRMIGSMIIADFPDRAALDEWVTNDPYVTGDVWRDVEIVPWQASVGTWMPHE